MFAGRFAARATRAVAPRAVRTYAAPATSATSAAARPPVALYGLDGTYASALYTAAVKTQTLDSTAKALESLSTLFKGDAKLQQILVAPTLSLSDKSQIIAELQNKIGAQKDETIKNFLEALAENNRLSVLEGVCEKFTTLMSAQKGETELVVTSAAPLDNKVIKQLETAISKSQYVGQGKKLKVVSKVNPDIKGGLIVEIGDRTIDLSVSAKLARMNKLLKDTL